VNLRRRRKPHSTGFSAPSLLIGLGKIIGQRTSGTAESSQDDELSAERRRAYNDPMARQNAPANAKRLLRALIDRGNPVAPEGRITQVAAGMGLNDDEIRPAIKYAKAQGWLEDAKFGHTKGWLSITPGGKAAAESP
jgi:hypothetical protein